MTDKPDWWPKNPYPVEIFPMPRDEYENIIPDPHTRTALSGMLGREFWEIASDTIWSALTERLDELEMDAHLGERGDTSKNLMEYKGYIGSIEFDNEIGVFHGEVINMRDVVTFRGTTVDELRQALVDSIEDYLEFCAQRGEEPEKPSSKKYRG